MTNNAIIIEKLPNGDGGANILSGTTDPTPDLGDDGQIYLKYKGPSPGAQEFSFFTQADTPYLVGDTDTYGSYSLYLDAYNPFPNDQFLAFCYGGNHAVVLTTNHALYNTSPFNFRMDRFASGKRFDYDWFSSDGVVFTDYITDVYYNHPAFSAYYVPHFTTRDEGIAAVRDFLANGKILAVYLKVNGAWQALIGSNLDDVNTES